MCLLNKAHLFGPLSLSLSPIVPSTCAVVYLFFHMCLSLSLKKWLQPNRQKKSSTELFATLRQPGDNQSTFSVAATCPITDRRKRNKYKIAQKNKKKKKNALFHFLSMRVPRNSLGLF